MTSFYFVRHATPNFNNHNDLTRELSPQGLKDRKLVTAFLYDKNIDVAFSSPYKRAIDTIAEFADVRNLEIKVLSDFRERKVGNSWIDNFDDFCKKQWEDFDFKLSDGESLREVTERNITALNNLLEAYEDKNIVVGSHGTAMSTIIHYFDPSFGYKDFYKIKNLMPWIVKLSFEGKNCLKIETHNLFL